MPTASSDGASEGGAEAGSQPIVQLTTLLNLLRAHEEEGAGSLMEATFALSDGGQKFSAAAEMGARVRGDQPGVGEQQEVSKRVGGRSSGWLGGEGICRHGQ
jgi:hypothetical protein